MLSDLCCYNGCLPQGAPTSPFLANLAFKELDQDLSILAKQTKKKYSRYADDLTFSANDRIEENFLKLIQKCVEKYSFELKREKTRFSGRGDRMEVTGVVINEKLQPSRAWRKRIRARLHRLSKADRLTRRDVSFLQGIKGISGQFPHSPQMCNFSTEVTTILEQLSQTVIGRSDRPILPNGLTIRQAEVLASLGPKRTDAEIADRLQTTESAIQKRLQEAFKKISVDNRIEAEKWALKYL